MNSQFQFELSKNQDNGHSYKKLEFTEHRRLTSVCCVNSTDLYNIFFKFHQIFTYNEKGNIVQNNINKINKNIKTEKDKNSPNDTFLFFYKLHYDKAFVDVTELINLYTFGYKHFLNAYSNIYISDGEMLACKADGCQESIMDLTNSKYILWYNHQSYLNDIIPAAGIYIHDPYKIIEDDNHFDFSRIRTGHQISDNIDLSFYSRQVLKYLSTKKLYNFEVKKAFIYGNIYETSDCCKGVGNEIDECIILFNFLDNNENLISVLYVPRNDNSYILRKYIKHQGNYKFESLNCENKMDFDNYRTIFFENETIYSFLYQGKLLKSIVAYEEINLNYVIVSNKTLAIIISMILIIAELTSTILLVIPNDIC